MRPVMRGLMKYETLITPGVATLEDVARCNDAIDAQDENERRVRKALEK